MLDYSFNHPINVHFGKTALEKMPDEIKKYMVNIWGVDADLPAAEACEKGVENIIAYYKKVGLPTKYNDIKAEMPSKEELIKATEAEYADNMMPMDEIVALFRDCMNL